MQCLNLYHLPKILLGMFKVDIDAAKMDRVKTGVLQFWFWLVFVLKRDVYVK